MARCQKRSKAPKRPVTFNAAERLGAFGLAQWWAGRTAWPIGERTAYDDLSALACMSALAKWLRHSFPGLVNQVSQVPVPRSGEGCYRG
jgi:hypothetical protein